jgi:hypothetical protein
VIRPNRARQHSESNGLIATVRLEPDKRPYTVPKKCCSSTKVSSGRSSCRKWPQSRLCPVTVEAAFARQVARTSAFIGGWPVIREEPVLASGSRPWHVVSGPLGVRSVGRVEIFGKLKWPTL